MTDLNIEADYNSVDPQMVAIDEMVTGGWDAVIAPIRTTSDRLIELMANIYVHRKAAMEFEAQRDCGLKQLCLDADDFVNLIGSYRPQKRSDFKLDGSQLDSPFELVRKEFPSSKLLRAHTRTIDSAFETTLDAVEVLTEHPGMPIPTFEQLATAYVELARMRGVYNALFLSLIHI